jgi:predicted nucleic acid-binding protein
MIHLDSCLLMLIATSALVDDAPLITRNIRDFSRMAGLRVVRY